MSVLELAGSPGVTSCIAPLGGNSLASGHLLSAKSCQAAKFA